MEGDDLVRNSDLHRISVGEGFVIAEREAFDLFLRIKDEAQRLSLEDNSKVPFTNERLGEFFSLALERVTGGPPEIK
jgi:hypothetical protein